MTERLEAVFNISIELVVVGSYLKFLPQSTMPRNVFYIFQKILFGITVYILVIVTDLKNLFSIKVVDESSNDLSSYITTNVFIVSTFVVFTLYVSCYIVDRSFGIIFLWLLFDLQLNYLGHFLPFNLFEGRRLRFVILSSSFITIICILILMVMITLASTN